MAVELGLLTADYERSSIMNGMALCADCHISFFTPNLIALSPPAPVLDYICGYLLDESISDRKPLIQVFDLLRQAKTGVEVPLPDPRSTLPFLGLFTIFTLEPNDLVGCSVTTQHLPGFSQLQDNHFSSAPPGTSPAAQNVARIFDVMAIVGGDPPITHGDIPLWSGHLGFRQQRYWRLPGKMEAVLAVLIERTRAGVYGSREI